MTVIRGSGPWVTPVAKGQPARFPHRPELKIGDVRRCRVWNGRGQQCQAFV